MPTFFVLPAALWLADPWHGALALVLPVIVYRPAADLIRRHQSPHQKRRPRRLPSAPFVTVARHSISELSRTELAPGLSSPGQLAILGQALAYREAAGACPPSGEHPAALCADQADALDKTDAYLALARKLRIELDR